MNKAQKHIYNLGTNSYLLATNGGPYVMLLQLNLGFSVDNHFVILLVSDNQVFLQILLHRFLARCHQTLSSSCLHSHNLIREQQPILIHRLVYFLVII